MTALRELAAELWHILTDPFRSPSRHDNEDISHA